MRIAIIGAGATGLAAAHDLIRAGHQVHVFESSPGPGGLASGFRLPNWDWSLERFYHHWFSTDEEVFRLATEIGVRDKIRFFRPSTVIHFRDRFYPFDSPRAWLQFPGLSMMEKAQFAAAGAYLRVLTRDWRGLERETAAEWSRRWMGERLFELLWQPLLEGKFGEYANQVNMAWLWARLKVRTPSLGTFEGGFQKFFDALVESLQQRGAEISFSTSVDGIQRDDVGRWHLRLQSQRAQLDEQVLGDGPPRRALGFDQVLVTTAPRVLSRLVPELPPTVLQGLLSLRSLGAVVVIFALDRPLSPEKHYWFNLPKRAGFPFLVLCEHTNFVPADHYGGQTIVYCGDYVASNHPYFSMTDQELTDLFQSELVKFNPAFDASWVRGAWVFRETYAQPVPLVDHSENLPPTRLPLPGLFFASMSHVYPWDRGTNFALGLGRRVAAEMLTNPA